MSNKQKNNILHITHSWGGGIPIYVSDLQNILSDEFNIFVLKSADNKVVLEHPSNDNHHISYDLPQEMGLLDVTNLGYKKVLKSILLANDIDLIHVNITLSHSFDVFYVARDLNIPVAYTVHDFFYICPTFHLVNKDGMHCKVCEFGNENEKCIKDNPYIMDDDFNVDKLHDWRTQFDNIKSMIDQYIFPSESCKKIFSSYYDIKDKVCHVIPHGTSVKHCGDILLNVDNELRVGILGSMLKHKGESLYKTILDDVKDVRVKFYHFGDGFLENEKLISIGAYKREDVVKILREHKIDVVLLLSTWPETFSYTLSETIAAGIPPIVTNHGAQCERVENNKIGWVVDYKKPHEVSELLEYLLLNKSEIEAKQKKLIKTPLNLLSKMKNEYKDVYNTLISASGKQKKVSTEEKLKAKMFLNKISCELIDATAGENLGAVELFEKSIKGKM